MASTLAALKEAKSTIGRLIASIEEHHATSNCYDSGIWALANREYRALDMLRSAITAETPCPCGSRAGKGHQCWS